MPRGDNIEGASPMWTISCPQRRDLRMTRPAKGTETTVTALGCAGRTRAAAWLLEHEALIAAASRRTARRCGPPMEDDCLASGPRGLDCRRKPVTFPEPLDAAVPRRNQRGHLPGTTASHGRRLNTCGPLGSRPMDDVILLDEPTLGLDSQDKRRVWAVLLSMRAKSTIVLSTHDVEEADLLADRILLMGQRTLLCSGSPRYVEALLGTPNHADPPTHVWLCVALPVCGEKGILLVQLSPGYASTFRGTPGVGYHVHMEKTRGLLATERVLEVAKWAAPEARLEVDAPGEAVLAMGTLGLAGFGAMFSALQTEASTLGIGAIRVSVTTLKDAYARRVSKSPQWLPGRGQGSYP
ncbi:hypothetical protein ISCGN_026636 [Ixodes scapularis]